MKIINTKTKAAASADFAINWDDDIFGAAVCNMEPGCESCEG